MRLQLQQDVITQRVAADLVLLKLGTGDYFGLDAVGARMLELLMAHDERARVVELLLAEFEVERAQLETDLAGLVARLEAQGLVRAA
jgi:hypothetical protein